MIPTARKDALLAAMVAAAVAGGRSACLARTGPLSVRLKADSSPVTKADIAVDAILHDHMSSAAPGITLVSEERSLIDVSRSSAFLLIDPIDGTKEFMANRDDFTINVALVEDGRASMGVVCAPARGKVYAGDVDAGTAFACDMTDGDAASFPRRRIRARTPPGTGIVAAVSRSHGTTETDAYLRQHSVIDTLAVGSSLKFCVLADGQADIYPRLGRTMEWDTAAGHAVLVAAGGSVCVMEHGAELSYGKAGFFNPPFVARGAAGGPRE
jgi:3'(2'), 5'-bisphosphate nucleotidase